VGSSTGVNVAHFVAGRAGKGQLLDKDYLDNPLPCIGASGGLSSGCLAG
jgi:hypothetical protein